jgi:hypothetical protein
MTKHPYQEQPDSAFWRRNLGEAFRPENLVALEGFQISRNDRIVSAGSCFAAEIVPYLEEVGLNYLRTERLHPKFLELGENLGYANFSAAYGNIYTVRQLLQLLQRSLGLFKPSEDRWVDGDLVRDPFRPGLRFPALSNEEFDCLTNFHLDSVKMAFGECSLFIFTLGLTEAWVSAKDGAVFPVCPGTIGGEFNASNHIFHDFSVDEINQDLVEFCDLLRSINKDVKFLFTVSPVPLVATAKKENVVLASTYSKSVLRVAINEVLKSVTNAYYFPSYEIITSPHSGQDFFDSDRRSVTKRGVQSVINSLLYFAAESALLTNLNNVSTLDRAIPDLSSLSTRISQLECDELAVEL